MKAYGKLDLRCADCMDLLRDTADNAYDLAIVDPPYGIGVGEGLGKWFRQRGTVEKEWDSSIPTEEYFSELLRVSRVQIIWGGNYFPLPPSRCFIVWDKGAGFKGRTYAECELAWCSLDANAKIFQRDPLCNGDYHGKMHPTQKPVALYRWLLENYAKEGDKILDTHLGSGSIAIACYYMGFDLTGCELDPDYYAAMMARIERETRQQEFDLTP